MVTVSTLTLSRNYADKKVHLLICIFLCIFMYANTASATVLGTQGTVYEIAEKSMLELIYDKAKNFDFLDWKYKQLERINETINKFRPSDAVGGLPASINNTAYKVDMSYTLPYDIRDVTGNVIYPKGFTYNPLELMTKKGIPFSRVIVVLNGTRKNEIEWFKSKFRDYKAGHIMLLITDGYAIELSQDLGREVRYLPEVLKERFRVKSTPSIVAQLPKDKNLTVRPYLIDLNGREIKDSGRARKRGR